MNHVIFISLVGAGLVLLGLMLLWFLMDILVRTSSQKNVSEPEDKTSEPARERPEQKLKAAAVSTAIVLALQHASLLTPDEESYHCLTAWQSLHRYQQLNNKLHNR